MPDLNNAIGVFDSGVGGLTVVQQLMNQMPNESIIYLGDTARVPYGTKSAETVIRYASSCAKLLIDRGIKLLVVACNTASAHSLEHLRDVFDVPIVGVVDPGARTALEHTRTHRIGIIGTRGTIESQAYQKALKAGVGHVEIFTQPCPLFVPLADEGWTSGDIPKKIAKMYLSSFKEHEIDTLILGCTHYPLLKNVIAEVMGPDVTIVDSADATAKSVKDTLDAMDSFAHELEMPIHQFYVSDSTENFKQIGEAFLGRPIPNVEWVDF